MITFFKHVIIPERFNQELLDKYKKITKVKASSF